MFGSGSQNSSEFPAVEDPVSCRSPDDA